MNSSVQRGLLWLRAPIAGLLALCLWTGVALAQPKSDPEIWIDFGKLQRAQPDLLSRQFARLSEGKSTSDVYVIGMAGWSGQDVFIKELEGAIASLGKVVPLSADRTVRLINNLKTIDTVPVANPDNFAAAVRAVGQSMNKQDDILILFVTSHGSENGAVMKLGRALVELSPHVVNDILNREQIKNRIVIVSACYSGVYVAPLANDDTIVMTAADAKNPSFGCGAKRSWTYFGDAFFNRSLKPGVSLNTAFTRARTMIGKWEAAGKLKPSNPQGRFGEAMLRKVDLLWRSAAQPKS